jgi:foldase protein PrsA
VPSRPHSYSVGALPRRLAIIIGVIVAAVVVIIILIAAGGNDHSVPKGAVADVDGKPITKAQFDHWLNIVVAVQRPPKSKQKPVPPKPGTKAYQQVAQQVLQFLTTALWIEGEAADRGVTASADEIKAQFKQTKQQSFPSDKAYQKFLKQSEQTQADIDYRVKLDVLSNKIRQEVTADTGNISDKDVEDYYNKNKQQFSQPERRDVRVVLTKTTAKAQEALKALQGGEDFKKVAKQFSDDPATKDQGGQLLGITQGQQEPTFDKALFAAQQGKLAGPIKTSRGYYVFQVTKITPATTQPLEQSKAGIRQLLVSQKQQQALDKFTTGFRDKWRKKTDCLKSLAIPDCSNGKQPPPPGLGTGPAALSGAGKPPALGGAQTQLGAGAAAGLPSAPGAIGAPPTGAAPTAASSPPALTGAGQAPALSAAPVTPSLPSGAAPPTQQAPQGSVPPGG